MSDRFYCDSPGCGWTGGDDDLPQYQDTGEAAGVPYSVTMIDADHCPQCGHNSLQDSLDDPLPEEDTSCAPTCNRFS